MKNQFTIKKATIKDLDDILRLNFDLFKKEYKEFDKSLDMKWTYSREGKKYFKDRIIKRDGFVEVLKYNGEIIGYLAGGLVKKKDYRINAKYAEVENMLIEKKYRGQGLGAQLMKNFINWCKGNKVDYISLTASAGNKYAIEFYRTMGFKDYNLTLERKLKK